MKYLYFIFKKRSGVIILYAFKLGSGCQLRLIDEDKRDLSLHKDLMAIEKVIREVNEGTWVQQKTVHVDLLDDLYDKYNKGHYSSEFDTLSGATDALDDAADGASNPNNIAVVVNQVLQQQQRSTSDLLQQQQRANGKMMQQLLDSMTLLMKQRETKKMTVSKFDGTSEDPRSWMAIYLRACEINLWDNDALKISNLKQCLKEGSAADKWYTSRIIDEGGAAWDEWEESFFEAFTQNTIQAGFKATKFFYSTGSLMDYYYEKERLMKIAFPFMDETSFVTFVLMGLPQTLQAPALSMDPKNKSELIWSLQKLPEVNKTRDQPNTKNDYRGNKTFFGRNRDNRETQVKSSTFQPKPANNDKRDKQRKVNAVTADWKEKKEDATVNVVTNVTQSDGRKLPLFKVNCNGNVVQALLDSGSDMNLVSSHLVNKYKWKTIPHSTMAVGFNGSKSLTQGKCNLHIEFSIVNADGKHDIAFEVEASIINGLSSDLILGYPSLQEAGIKLFPTPVLTPMQPTEIMSTPIKSIGDVEKVYPSLLRQNYIPQHQVAFELQDDAPIIQCRPHRLSENKLKWLQGKINCLLKDGAITESSSKYATPVCIVDKEDNDYRLCNDYRPVNVYTDLDPFPFPLIDNVITGFGGCNFFSKFDLKDGFNQLGLTPETRKYTAFITPFGHFEWTRLPFGWKNSAPLFQRTMVTKVLGDLAQHPNVAVYIDDIICGGKTEAENQELTHRVLQKLQENGFTLNAKKCIFHVASVPFLGRIMDGRTRTTREESITKVMNMVRPHDLHTLRVFLGLTGHFRSYIPDYASIARPLDNLKKKDVIWSWTNECENAFISLKKIITANPILSFPDWSLKFELCTDASHLGTGAILYQRDPSQPRNKQLRVIGFYSYTFKKAEINYSVTEKEALAVIMAIKHFRSFIEGKQFVVNTDHSALTSLMTLKEPKNRLARWQMFLLSFQIEINHRKGILLKDADAISRLCLSNPTTEITSINQVVSIDNDEIKRLILKKYHDDPESGGHDGLTRTMCKIKARFLWKGMNDDIREYVQSCHECQMIKFKYRKKFHFQTLVNHGSSPYEVVHLDFGELKKKSDTNVKSRFFILLVDEYSRMSHTKAMTGMKSSFLIQWLKQLPFFKSVKKIISDNGTSFQSEEFKRFCSDNQIKQSFSGPYHPEGNGLAERHIQEVKLFMSLYPHFAGGWKSCLEAATKHHNRSYCSSIGCSPHFKLTGQSALFPADKEFGITEETLLKKETSLTEEKQTTNRLKVIEKANLNAGKIPNIEVGGKIIYQAGYKGKEPIIKGPVEVTEVVKRESIPKTLLFQEGKKKQVVALKNCLPYKTRPRVSTTMMSLIMMTTLLTLVSSSSTTNGFDWVSPVPWTRTTTPVIDSVHHYQHRIVVATPCSAFLRFNIPLQQKTDLIMWCQKHMDDDFWNLLKRTCYSPPTKRVDQVGDIIAERKKRFIDPISIAVGTIIFSSLAASITSLGVSIYDHNTIDKLSIEQQEEIRFNRHTREYMEELTTDLIKITGKLEALEEKFNQLFHSYPNITALIADVSSNFTIRRHEIQELVYAMKEKRVSRRLFDFFNFKPPEGSILELAEFISCHMNKTSGYLELDYFVPVKKKHASIFEASPFELSVDVGSKNETATCAVKYVGPHFAMVTDKCIFPLDTNFNTVTKTAFIYSGNNATCNQKFTTLELWNKTRCGFDVEVPSQVKVTNGGTFVFCPKKQIMIANQMHDCPIHSFRLDRGVSFELEGFNYTAQVWFNEKIFSFIDQFRITPVIAASTKNLTSLVPDLENILAQLRVIDTEEATYMDKVIQPGFLIQGLVVVTLLLLVRCFLWKRKPCCSQPAVVTHSKTSSEPEEEIIPMKPFHRVLTIAQV